MPFFGDLFRTAIEKDIARRDFLAASVGFVVASGVPLTVEAAPQVEQTEVPTLPRQPDTIRVWYELDDRRRFTAPVASIEGRWPHIKVKCHAVEFTETTSIVGSYATDERGRLLCKPREFSPIHLCSGDSVQFSWKMEP